LPTRRNSKQKIKDHWTKTAIPLKSARFRRDGDARSVHDGAERRGLWFVGLADNFTAKIPEDGVIIVWGREGNDDRFEMRVGEVFTQEKLEALTLCLLGAACVQDEYRGCDWPPSESMEFTK
jgi:hypothetical protein